MIFKKSETEFPSYVHKVIYLNVLRQTPIEISIGETEGIEPLLIESCRAYYDFIMEMHSNMYEDPAAWGMKPGEYDEFLGNLKENGMKQMNPTKTKALRSRARNCVHSYLHLLLSLGRLGELKNNALYLQPEVYLGMRRFFDKSLDAKMKNLFNDIPYEVRLNGFKRVGFIISEDEHGIVIQSENHPNMLYAMSVLAKLEKHEDTFGEHNFLHCDFRQIFNGYIPRYEDVVQPLQEEQKSVIDQVHAFAMEMKLSCACTTYWKVNCHYKGKQVMCIDTDDRFEDKSRLVNTVRIRINGTNHGAAEYLDKIAGQGEDEIKYYMKHMNYCTACSTSHLGGKQPVFGRNVRLCGPPSFRIVNPVGNDLDRIRRFIELRKEMIVLEKATK